MNSATTYEKLINDIAGIIAEKESLAEIADKLESLRRKIESLESLATKYASDRIKED